MRREAASEIMTTLLLIGMLTLAFYIQPVRASGTIYIRADGSVEPSTANITSTDNVTYYFTDNNYDEIVVERDNILVDGAGYTVQGIGAEYSKGIDLTGRSNVTIKNMEIKSFYYGIWLNMSSRNVISGNNITANNGYGIDLSSDSNNNTISSNNIENSLYGIGLFSSSNNTISGNNITANNYYGIKLSSSSNNTISGNNITANNEYGIELHSSSNNTISGNDIANNYYGIYLYGSSSNIISENNITANNQYGIQLYYSSNNNAVYHNNFVDNTQQVYSSDSTNVWDDGYPSGGNYWSDHVCTGNPSDGSQPYIINADNIDHYPFQDPNGWLLPPPEHELIVYLEVPDHVQPDETSLLNATVHNRGLSNETSVPLQLLINGTIVDSVVIPELLTGSSYTLSYLWTPTVEGIYNITAYAPPVLGENFTANNLDTKFIVVGYPLISYWKFDEGSGTIAYDSVGANHGTIHGATWTTGIVGNALSFDGLDDYVSLSNSLPDLGSLTIGAWVYYTGGSNVATIFMDATTAGGNDFVFDMSSSGIGIRADKSGATLAYEDASAITGLDLGNAWHHIT